MTKNLIKRDILDEILKYINIDDVLVLHGARQVGKTSIMLYLQDQLNADGEKTYFFDLEDSRKTEILDAGVENFLSYLEGAGFDWGELSLSDKKLFVFIDEIQNLKKPSSFLKLLADHHKYLKLIVSGSSSFDIKNKFSDSLVGRIVNFEVFNLSFSEFLRFKSINYNLEQVSKLGKGPIFEDIIRMYREYVFYGGYPKIVLQDSIEIKEKYLQIIIDTYVRKDIRDLANIVEIEKFNNLLKVLAAQSGQLLSVSATASTIGLAAQTVEQYLSILENTYIIKLVHPFSRSANVEVSKAPKIFFYDTGLLQVLRYKELGARISGDLFETSVFAELVKKYGREHIYFWRTHRHAEVDFVLDLRASLLPIEVKTNFRNFQKHAVGSFCQKYRAKDYKVVGLEGKKKDEHCVYPWEL
ncbi:ATP-binding protein [Candidatus Peregrinibacteria bacterium]|nr:ATP-binding protein [Candidatus Peregrinibacteria bacterium]